jgi:mannitol-specific phosphotransferase system IIBC component
LSIHKLRIEQAIEINSSFKENAKHDASPKEDSRHEAKTGGQGEHEKMLSFTLETFLQGSTLKGASPELVKALQLMGNSAAGNMLLKREQKNNNINNIAKNNVRTPDELFEVEAALSSNDDVLPENHLKTDGVFETMAGLPDFGGFTSSLAPAEIPTSTEENNE